MEHFLIIFVAFSAAILTLFSGFGLGTMLMPVFALFFPVEIAIAMTAVVHLANNLFKFTLVWQAVNLKVVLKFALPAAAAAFAGASLLTRLSGSNVLFTYEIGDKLFQITSLKLVISLLLVFFALMEIVKRLEKIHMNRTFLPLGGLLSGFFGGLSGS